MKKQPKPKKNKSVPVYKEVIKAIEKRNKLGIDKYGTSLQAFNNRNCVQDIFEEELDKIQYIMQWMKEREEIITVLHYYTNLDSENGVAAHNEEAKNLLIKMGEFFV